MTQPPPGCEDATWQLRLYVAGQSPRSLAALANLTVLCEQHLAGRYRIEVVDLVQNPQRASTDNIVVLPTLIRRQPAPPHVIIGDLSNTDRVLAGLKLTAA